MIRILATDGLDKDAIALLEEKGCEVKTDFYEPDALCEAIKEFDILVVRSATKVRAAQIDAAARSGRLKLIIRAGVGVDNIDVNYAKEKGIDVANTPKSSSDAVAELAIAHMFSVARFISDSGHSMREGRWEKKAYKGIELSGKTVGIVGYGRIGQALGKRCQALGMNVLAYDIFRIPDFECDTMRYVSLDELLGSSDIISLHVPSLDGQPFINVDSLSKMKNGVIIINTSRGTNVDEKALYEALESGKVYGAGLDVWTEEPLKESPLLSHPRVSCTPHIGANTKEAQKRIGHEVVSVICEKFCI